MSLPLTGEIGFYIWSTALLEFSVDFSLDQRQTEWRKLILAAHPDSYKHNQYNLADHLRGTCTLRGIRRQLVLKMEGLARVSKHGWKIDGLSAMIGTATIGPLACCCLYFEGDFSINCHSADEEGVLALPGPLMAHPCIDRLFSKNGRMLGGAGRRTSTSFEAINASSATGIPNLVR